MFSSTITGATMVLSQHDQDLIRNLYAKNVLQEARLDYNLRRVLLVTDHTNSNPPISPETLPACVIKITLGGCALHNVTSDADQEERRTRALRKVRANLQEVMIDHIVLVTSVPSEPNRSFVDAIDQLRSAEEVIREAFGRSRQIHSFICVRFPDGRAYTLYLNSPEFRAWYNEYEQTVLGRQDD